MKKILTLVLVVAMVATLAIGVFAVNDINDDFNITDKATSTANITINNEFVYDSGAPVYSVDVVWAGTTLNPTTTFSGSTWNPSTHEWENVSNYTTDWKGAKVTVTITNHSNADIKATISALDASDSNVTLSADNASVVCESAATAALGTPDATVGNHIKTITITPSGNTNAATITASPVVTISAN